MCRCLLFSSAAPFMAAAVVIIAVAVELAASTATVVSRAFSHRSPAVLVAALGMPAVDMRSTPTPGASAEACAFLCTVRHRSPSSSSCGSRGYGRRSGSWGFPCSPCRCSSRTGAVPGKYSCGASYVAFVAVVATVLACLATVVLVVAVAVAVTCTVAVHRHRLLLRPGAAGVAALVVVLAVPAPVDEASGAQA